MEEKNGTIKLGRGWSVMDFFLFPARKPIFKDLARKTQVKEHLRTMLVIKITYYGT